MQKGQGKGCQEEFGNPVHPVARHDRFHDAHGYVHHNQAGREQAEIECQITCFKGHDQPGDNGCVEKQFAERPQFYKAEVRTAVVQYHDFVNHGQFQMGGRIVHRNP